jgi:hypothetical protein
VQGLEDFLVVQCDTLVEHVQALHLQLLLLAAVVEVLRI